MRTKESILISQHYIAAFAAVVGVVAFSARGFASDAPTVHVELEGCQELPAREVQRVVQAELGAHADVDAAAVSAYIRIRCETSGLELQVRDALSRKVLTRRIDLSALDPPARARLLAIAAAELVIASWAELELSSTLRVAPEGRPPHPDVARAARLIVRRHRAEARERETSRSRRDEDPTVTRMLVAASMRRFLQLDGAIWGGGIRFAQDLPNHLSWMADGLFETGEVGQALGTFRTTTATVGGAVLLHQRWSQSVLRLGAGLRLGVVRTAGLDGEASRATSFVPWGWPAAVTSLSVWPSDSLVLELHGEASYAKLPVSAGARGDDPAVRGIWCSIQAAAGVRL
jgi:hypothetical protein